MDCFKKLNKEHVIISFSNLLVKRSMTRRGRFITPSSHIQGIDLKMERVQAHVNGRNLRILEIEDLEFSTSKLTGKMVKTTNHLRESKLKLKILSIYISLNVFTLTIIKYILTIFTFHMNYEFVVYKQYIIEWLCMHKKLKPVQN